MGAALAAAALLFVGLSGSARAGEDYFGYVKGTEPLPKGATELELKDTARWNKQIAHYQAYDHEIELEYGFTNRFGGSFALKGQSVDTEDILIDGYIPGDNNIAFKFSGLEGALKYNILSAAQDPIGLSIYFGLDYNWVDPHSGQNKYTLSNSPGLALQKYFLEGRMIWAGNIELENTIANRQAIDDLPPDFDWPTTPEVELEFTGSTGLTYRFIPNWYLGGEIQYQEERETEVGQERWSVFAGPTLHYGGKRVWTTLTWFPQVIGGGEKYADQGTGYHLIEKTRQEARIKIGYNF
jgi:hypothetical protein